MSSRPTAPPRVTRRFGVTTAALLVVASMVGTGVFTTTGFLLRDLGSSGAVLVAWVVGGLLAVSGALAYAELAAALPFNGGEYQLLSRIYHPGVGFVAGWISLVVGFSAPMAAAAVAFGVYAAHLAPGLEPRWTALGLILVLGAVHTLRVSWGSVVQNVATVLDVVLIVLFVLGALAMGGAPLDGGYGATRASADAVLSREFAVGLVYVSFSYSGWNAAVYVAGEVHAPERTLPRSLVLGSALVTMLYLGLNAVFVTAAPIDELSGAVDVAHVAARHLFGQSAARAVSVLISLGLLTTVGALLMTGPRVYEAMGHDYPRLSWIGGGRRGPRGPARAIAFQVAVACLMVLSMSFELLLTYMGLSLLLSSVLAIAGVFVARVRQPDIARPYHTWGYPWTMGAALALSAWALVYAALERPVAAAVSGGTLLFGYGLYLWVRR